MTVWHPDLSYEVICKNGRNGFFFGGKKKKIHEQTKFKCFEKNWLTHTKQHCVPDMDLVDGEQGGMTVMIERLLTWLDLTWDLTLMDWILGQGQGQVSVLVAIFYAAGRWHSFHPPPPSQLQSFLLFFVCTGCTTATIIHTQKTAEKQKERVCMNEGEVVYRKKKISLCLRRQRERERERDNFLLPSSHISFSPFCSSRTSPSRLVSTRLGIPTLCS